MPQAYDGYGSCPLTVEHGKIILAEFGYGGKLMPSFPWDSTKPRRSAWFLKKTVLPWVYWNAMLKGKEWLVKTTAYLPHLARFTQGTHYEPPHSKGL